MTTSPPPADAAPRRGTALRPAIALALVLMATKAVHVRPVDAATAAAAGRWILDLGIVTAADFAFAAAYGVAGALAFRAASAWPRVAALVRGVFVSLGILSALYAVIHVEVFAYMRRPLTVPMLHVAGDFGNMRDSISAFLTPRYIVALAGVPLVFSLLAWGPLPRRAVPSPRPRLAAAFIIATGLWFTAVSLFLLPRWGASHDERQIARNPHAALLASVLSVLLGGDRVVLTAASAPGDEDDFRPAGERPDGGGPTPGLVRGPRNVILVVLESVGIEHLSLYGSRYPTTPGLESEARHALVFDGIYAHITNTANSLVALTLGIYPPGLTWREPTVVAPRMPGESLAQILKSRGYRTAFLSSGDNKYANQQSFLTDRGFDTIRDWRDSGRKVLFSWGVADEVMVDMDLAFIDADRSRPFFVMCWNQGTHHPYELPPQRTKIDFFGKNLPPDDWDLGNYLNAVSEADRQISRLLDGLRSRGLADDTIVVITGDHGEAFGVPHGNYGHSYHVYEEDVHVPLVVWSPRLFDDAPRRATIGAHVDVIPTIADLLGVPAAPSWQGTSLLSSAQRHRAYFFGALDHFLLGVREGNFKYIANVSDAKEELYDLAADPREQTNLAESRRDVCERLRGRLAAWYRTQIAR